MVEDTKTTINRIYKVTVNPGGELNIRSRDDTRYSIVGTISKNT